MDQLTLYKSSAGSGKTTVLSKEYLKLALSGNFRSILAVTFTNKATNELKERVIEKLYSYTKEETSESEELRADLGLEKEEFRNKCIDVLDQILNNYGVFSISTIDAFFQKIIRSFARESGIQGNFKLELEPDLILDAAIARLFEEAGKNETLTKWLIRFSHETVENAEGSDLTNKVRALGKEVFQEEFKIIQSVVLKEGDMERFIRLEKELLRIQKSFEDRLKKSGTWIIEKFRSYSLAPDDLKRGIGKEIEGLLIGVIPDFQKATIINALSDPKEFATKSSKKREIIIQAANDGIFDELSSIYKFVLTNSKEYYTAKVIAQNLYTFGIISDLLRKIEEYKIENDTLLLSDSSLFLSQIIEGYDSPFIYEKVGSRYQHFLIDEFQDTSRFQWNNFRPLLENSLSEGRKSVIVGDVKQSIYRWRGGDWNLLANQVQDQIPSSESRNLNINWRSNAQIIDFNNTFFRGIIEECQSTYTQVASSKVEGDKVASIAAGFKELYKDVEQVIPDHRNPEEGYVSVDIYPGKDDQDFMSYSLDKMILTIEKLQSKGLKARDIAILVRKRFEGERVASHIIKHSKSDKAVPLVNYDVVSSEILRVANSPSINLLIAVMKWINKPEERIPLVSFISDYLVYFDGEEHNLSEVFENIYNQNLKSILPDNFEEEIGYISKLQLYELSEELIRKFDLAKRKEEWPYLLGFQDELIQNSSKEAGDLSSFLEWWEIHGWNIPVNISEEIDAIKIMTIHKAKGLQFQAVIIPFSNWKIEPDGLKQEIIWADCPIEPFSLFSYYPLKYSSSLAKSYFVDHYLREKSRHYIDNINMLYVAFTRAIQGLYITVPQLGSTETVGTMISNVLSEGSDMTHWETGLEEFKPVNLNEKESSIYLKNFHSHRWNEKVTVSTKELIKLKEDVYEKVEMGIIMHNILSELNSPDNADDLIGLYFKRGKINTHQRKIVTDSVKTIISDPRVREWFNGDVINERVILAGNGSMRVPDKVIVYSEKVVVVDFKTGVERPEHQKQVEEYMDLLKELYEKKVEGNLCYLQPFKIIEVK